MKFSIYTGGIKSVLPNREIDIIEFCNILKDENKKEQINIIRREKDKDKKKKLKSKLDYVTFAGTFKKRNDNEIKKLSGYCCLDFDDLENPSLDREIKLSKDKYTHLVFISPSGRGLKVIIKTPKSLKNKEEYNLIVKNAYYYFENKYNLKGDEATHDLSRACFISYDPNYIYNPKSNIFDKLEEIKTKKNIKPKQVQTYNKKRVDIFFTELIKNPNKSINELNKADKKHILFLKNMCAFSCWNQENINEITEFISLWDKERIDKYNDWIKTCKENKYKVNYFELYYWAKEYNLTFFLELLDKQINISTNSYSTEEYEKAMDIVKKYPLKYCLDVVTKRHIGEELILLLLIFSATSTGFRDRKLLLHIMGIGSSGKGKTDSMECVGKIFSNMYTITSASPKSIFYQSKDRKLPDNGILFYPENDNKEDFEALERVLTDDKDETPSHNTVINGESVELDITQKNVFWRNSVGTSEDEDNQTNNRYYIYNVDESEQQDEKIFEHILDSWNYLPSLDNSDINIAKAITDIIKSEPKNIYIPYVKYITLSRKEDRRILKKFLKLINAITYFNRFQRINVGDYIISYVDDFLIANEIWKNINKYESSKLTETESIYIDLISSEDGLSATDIAKKLKKDISNTAKKLKEMEEKGILYSEYISKSNYDDTTGDRYTRNHKIYYASRWYLYSFELVTPTTIDENCIKSDFKRLNIEESDIEKSFVGSTGSRKEGGVKKIFFEVFTNFNTSLTLKLLPINIYNKYNILNIDSISTLDMKSSLVKSTTNELPTNTNEAEVKNNG